MILESPLNSLVSVIIPTFNRVHLIERCLISIVHQTYTYWECIIVDDFSTDGTKNLIDSFKARDNRFIYLKNQRSKGAPGARNTGLKAARGEYVTFLDSDDTINTNCLESRLKHAIEYNADVTVGLQQMIIDDVEHKLVNIYSDQDPLIRFFSYLPNCDVPWINNTLLKTSFLKRNTIYWDESLKMFQDIQFNLDLLLHKPKVCWTNEIDSRWIHLSNVQSIGKNRRYDLRLLDLLYVYNAYYQKIIDGKKSNLKAIKRQFKSAVVAISHAITYHSTEKEIFNKDYEAVLSNILSRDCRYLLMAHNRIWQIKTDLITRLILKLIRFYLSKRNLPVINQGYFQKESANKSI